MADHIESFELPDELRSPEPRGMRSRMGHHVDEMLRFEIFEK